ncbi:hypothetical protein IEO70_05590 [Bacillus sp. AGMB 02131]|uniref:Pilus assembly protein PilO n=1 Tax=Peribacillus faecalis TaxID=2772559 RepID=A0A927CUJ3_9BACI|nr:hypothetical protein [Peribacillus faecalis]MBD3107833.1 hypothetical protein [Peribacillus faecalis]
MNKLDKLDKKWKIIALSGLLGVSVLAAIYFYVIYPKSDDLQSKERELQALETELAIIQTEQNKKTEEPRVSSVELQKKIPVKPNVQQIIVDFNQAEIVSGSLITNIAVEENVEIGQPVASAGEEDESESESESESVSEPVSVPAQAIEGLKQVRLSLTVQSERYADLEKFLSSLESLERITKVENISFEGFEEITSVDQTRSILEYTVVVSAYYASKLKDLQEDLPRVRSAEPANKTNPLYESPILQRRGQE